MELCGNGHNIEHRVYYNSDLKEIRVKEYCVVCGHGKDIRRVGNIRTFKTS